MSAGAFKAYLNVTTQQEQLRIQADKIINSDYTDAEKSKNSLDSDVSKLKNALGFAAAQRGHFFCRCT